MEKRTKIIGGFAILLLLMCLGVGGAVYYYLFAPQFYPAKTAYVYVDRDDTVDSIYNKVKSAGKVRTMKGFVWMAKYRNFERQIHTGRYAIRPRENVYHVFSRFYRGYQQPLNLTIGSVRTLDRMARNIGNRLMIDSAEIASVLTDSLTVARLGYTPQTLPALFIPNTYEVYWDISTSDLLERMQREHRTFWNAARLAKADSLHMTPEEVATLASIVEEETNAVAEMPMVAGLYINRLRKQMPLQADPTIKFALNDFGLRRITNAQLTVDSPYNTYRYAGLPPGPIRIPSPVALDAVLNYVRHNYIDMCAKEDFSGTHNFASNYGEHMKNAKRYWNALNKRKIFR